MIFLIPALLLAAPADLPGGLTAHLREAEVVHADFSQVRTLAALSRPVKASGSLVLCKGRGVIWQLKAPLSITYVMDPEGLLVVDAQGRRERRSAREAPVVAQMGRIFQSVVQGDWKGLEDLFLVTGGGDPAKWTVALRPKGEASAFLKGVEMSGGRFIERIRILEAGGDRMELTFARQRADAPLSDAEAALLAREP